MREGWGIKTFSDFLVQIHRPELVSEMVEVPFAGARWYAGGIYHRDTVAASEVKTKSLNRIHEGDVTYNRMWATKASFGVVHEEAAGCLVTNDFPVFSVDESVTLVPYVELIFHDATFQTQASLAATGTTERRRLKERDFLKLPINLPPLEEQRRIVDLIGSLDEAIEAADEASIATQSTACELRRESFERLASRFPSVPAGKMFEVVLGRQKSARQSVGDHVIPYIRAGNLTDGSLSLGVVQTMNFDLREQEKYCLRTGDVLIAEGGSVGQTSVWRGEITGPVGFDKHVLRVRGIAGKSTGDYAFQWARWCYESGRFAEAATGITIKALGFDRAKRITVPDASLSEQSDAVSCLLAADISAELAKGYATTLRTLRSELLTVLLSGEHEIPDSYRELQA